jgi:hypothetical protein
MAVPGVAQCSLNECYAALEVALASKTFSRSEQLRSFLRFLCEEELRGAGETINEYRIAVEALGRAKDYVPGEDSAVRTRAFELRQKLAKLYGEELTGYAVQIELPKGSYRPRFKHVTEQPQSETQPSASGPGRQITSSPGWRLVLIAILGAAALSSLLTAWFFKSSTKPALAITKASSLDPLIVAAWDPVAHRRQSVMLVPATPLYLVMGPKTHGAYGTKIYDAPPEAYPLYRQHRPLRNGAELGMIFTNDALGVGIMDAVLLASQTVRELGVDQQTLPERPDMMSVLHGRDAILFGAPVDSTLISDVLQSTPLTVDYDESVREFVVLNRRTGAKFIPEKGLAGEFHTVYGLITVLGAPASERGRSAYIVFSGITSVGAHGAAEFFTSAAGLKILRAKLAALGLHGFPPTYQVVVKCRAEEMLLVSSEFAAVQVISR